MNCPQPSVARSWFSKQIVMRRFPSPPSRGRAETYHLCLGGRSPRIERERLGVGPPDVAVIPLVRGHGEAVIVPGEGDEGIYLGLPDARLGAGWETDLGEQPAHSPD